MNPLLKERMGPEDESQLSLLYPPAELSLLPPAQRAGEKSCLPGERKLLQYLPELLIVLTGEELCRRHHGRLEAGGSREEESVKGDDGLPRSHISLQKAVHHKAAGELSFDLPDRFPLPLRERKGEGI